MAKIHISIPDPILEAFDKAARNLHLTRSEATLQAYKYWLANNVVPPKANPGFAVLEAAAQWASRQKPTKPNAVAMIRKDRRCH